MTDSGRWDEEDAGGRSRRRGGLTPFKAALRKLRGICLSVSAIGQSAEPASPPLSADPPEAIEALIERRWKARLSGP